MVNIFNFLAGAYFPPATNSREENSLFFFFPCVIFNRTRTGTFNFVKDIPVQFSHRLDPPRPSMFITTHCSVSPSTLGPDIRMETVFATFSPFHKIFPNISHLHSTFILSIIFSIHFNILLS